jgi:hypothetical protein
MITTKISLLPSRRTRRRVVLMCVALIMALPLLAMPELWQYLLAAVLVHDFLLRLHGDTASGDQGPAAPDRTKGERREAVGRTAESDPM